MKRILFSFLLFVTTITCVAQHLKFEGIPIDGHIDQFEQKLKQKGFNKKSDYDNIYGLHATRIFNGIFMQSNVRLEVVYYVKTKKVYQINIVPSKDNDEASADFFKRCKEMINSKYDVRSDDEEMELCNYFYHVFENNQKIGNITELNIFDKEKSEIISWIEYTDLLNFLSYEGYEHNEKTKSIVFHTNIDVDLYVDGIKVKRIQNEYTEILELWGKSYFAYRTNLSIGRTYTIKAKAKGYIDYVKDILIEPGKDNDVISITMEKEPEKTTIKVPDSSAEIYINNAYKGKGEWTGVLLPGNYSVECKRENYTTTYKTITVDKDGGQTYTIESPQALPGKISITTTPIDATVYIDGVAQSGTTPITYTNIDAGSHEITIEKKFFRSIHARTYVSPNTTSYVTKTMEKDKAAIAAWRLYKKNQIYGSASIQFGMLTAAGAEIGGYIYNLNLEAYYMHGLGTHDNVSWHVTIPSESDPHYTSFRYTYTPQVFGGRIGYGILCKKRVRFTPQLGIGIVSIHGKGNIGSSNGYVMSGTVGLKTDIAFCKHFGMFVAPEFSYKMKGSSVYNRLESNSRTSHIWGTGINCRAGLSVFF